MRTFLLAPLLLILLACQPVLQLQQNATKTECSPPYHEYKPNDCCLDKDTNMICDRDEEQVPETIALNTTTQAEPQKEQSIMQSIITKFRTNTTSYSYKEGKKEVYVQESQAHVRLDRLIPLDQAINNTIRVYVTDTFIDREHQTAIGYCDPRSEEKIMGGLHPDRSNCIKLINIPINLSYEEFSPELPEDWLTKFAGKKPFLAETTEQFIKEPTGWKTINPVLHYKTGDTTTVLRLDAKTGLPLKIEITKPKTSQVISYNWLIPNSVKKEEIQYQPFTR
jgi:hypothetical protein